MQTFKEHLKQVLNVCLYAKIKHKHPEHCMNFQKLLNRKKTLHEHLVDVHECLLLGRLLLKPELLGPKAINASNYNVNVAKCFHTKSYKV